MQSRPLPYSILILVIAVFYVPAELSADEQHNIDLAAHNYERLLGSALLEYETNAMSRNKPLDQVLDTISGVENTGDRTNALAIIIRQQRDLESHVDAQDFSQLVSFLLAQGLHSTAERFLHVAEHDASDYSLATLRLAFAHHYAKNAQWDLALQQLSEIAINTMLTPVDADHAHLIFGIAMQGKRMHQEAVDYYQRIQGDSPHYWLAQLNTALAHLRRGWWTDAQVAIEHALPAADQAPDDHSDRLYTVLGYSQIQYGFYRRARDSFRKVRLDGHHANRALLGLGLAALHQADLVGALNAFDHLKAGDPNDMSVAESYLLSAFTLAQIGRTTSASAAYAEAMAFYQHYLARLEEEASTLSESKIAEPIQLVSILPTDSAADLLLWHERLEILEHIRRAIHNRDLQRELQSLEHELSIALGKRVHQGLDARRQVIESYLNQANFGLAALYDNH